MMPSVIRTMDREALSAFFRRDPLLHLYELGDLDPFFWPSCQWHALASETGELLAVILEYACPLSPTLLALGRDADEHLRTLLATLGPSLPSKFYAHLSPGLERELGTRPREQRGRHWKMALEDRSALATIDTSGTAPLAPSDVEEIGAFYAEAYPKSWFDPRMLETGRYVGLREQGELVAIAGVHVHSIELGVAALGNIATLPSRRGRGLGTRVTAALCRLLAGEVETIGLNVEASNVAAIACYRRLGFVQAATYEEWSVG